MTAIEHLTVFQLAKHLEDGNVLENMGAHIFLLFELVACFEHPIVLELGTGRGGSLIPLALACKYKEGKVITVDLRGDEDSLKERDVVEQKIRDFNLGEYVHFIIGNDMNIKTIKEIEGLGLKPFNFIFMDTTKGYEHTIFELRNYSSLLSEGGFIALHDTHAKYDGVNKALDEFLEKNSNFIKIIDKTESYGLTVLMKSSILKTEKVCHDCGAEMDNKVLPSATYGVYLCRSCWDKRKGR